MQREDTYRIEHRWQGAAEPLGRRCLSEAYARRVAFPAYRARLLSQQATGTIVLINQHTGAVVARGDLWPEPDRRWGTGPPASTARPAGDRPDPVLAAARTARPPSPRAFA